MFEDIFGDVKVVSKKDEAAKEEAKFKTLKGQVVKVRKGRGNYILVQIGDKKLLCTLVEKWFWE